MFDRDWEHTQGCFKNIEQWVGEDETFLQTSNSLSDEGNNWGNRASFLRAHYEARALLNEEMRLGAPFDL